MTLTLPNLYCTPNDLYDYLGTEGTDLRVDDHNQADGNVVTVTAAAAAGATSVTVAALTQPILNGEVLQFDGGGVPQQVQVQLTAAAALNATALTVAPLPFALNVGSFATDNGVNLALAARLLKACRYGTTQVKLQVSGKYDDSDLANNASENGSVNWWATAIAAKWLCQRRGQSCPKGIAADATEAMNQMKQVRCNGLMIEDIATRTAGWPFISNLTHDIGYLVAQVRVESAISEQTPTQYSQRVDWSSIYWLEW